MTEAERKARLKEVDRRTAEVLADSFYRKHASLRKQTLDYLKRRRDELKPKAKTNPLFSKTWYLINEGLVIGGPYTKGEARFTKKQYPSLNHAGVRIVKLTPAQASSLSSESSKARAMTPKTKRNGFFDADAVKRARKVTRTPKESPKARRTVVEKLTGEKGYLLSTLPDGWLKVKWDHREKPTLIKRSELKRARNPKAKRPIAVIRAELISALRKENGWSKTQAERYILGGTGITSERELRALHSAIVDDKVKNPGILDLVGGMQALDYLSGKFKGARRRNPSPAEMSERFQGHATGSVKNYYASDSAPRLDFSRAGKLVFLKVNGKQIRIPYAVAAIDPKTEKIWIAGSKRGAMFTRKAARKGEALDFGEIESICYLTAKSHIGAGKRYEYVHAFGEEGGRRPHLLVDHEGMPILRGGDYKIRAEGIVD